MISKNQIKQINSLSQKKFRDELGWFIAEGGKLVADLLTSFNPNLILATEKWISENKTLKSSNIQIVTEQELKQISNQKSPQGILAVFEKSENNKKSINFSSELCLGLDDIQDPGNLGTIIRIADWFGIRNIFCSLLCVDAYSPKAVQASMGALSRVQVHYVDLSILLTEISTKTPIFGTFMDGNDIYSENLSSHGIIIMGNEGNGISENIEKLVTKKLLIPNFPKNELTSESLNVGVATALICAEFRRRQL